MHDPDAEEAGPAQAREAEDGVLVVARQLRRDRHQQHPQHDRGEVGLDAEPGDGDDRANDRRQLRAAGAEAHAADHREGHAGLLPHVAGQVHEEVDQGGAYGQGRQNLPAGEAQREQAHGEGIVGDVMHIVGPEGEDAVSPPAPTLAPGRRCTVLGSAYRRRRSPARKQLHPDAGRLFPAALKSPFPSSLAPPASPPAGLAGGDTVICCWMLNVRDPLAFCILSTRRLHAIFVCNDLSQTTCVPRQRREALGRSPSRRQLADFPGLNRAIGARDWRGCLSLRSVFQGGQAGKEGNEL
ncbi:hypothetical protein D9M69_436140 [compost metagenome]